MAKTKITRKGKLSVKEKDIDRALKESKEKRRKKTLRLYILFAILIVLFVILKFWESSEKQEIRELAMEVTPSIRADETSPNIAVEDTAGDVLDRGTQCRNHEYVLSPGASELLRFEIKLQREVLELSHLIKNKFETGDVSLESSFEKWEEHGLTVEVNSFDIDTVTDKINVWVVEAGELIEDVRKANQAADSGASGSFDNITGFIARKTRFKVDFFNDYYGVISTLGRYYYTEAKVGEIVKSDITVKLGGSLLLNYDYEGKGYQLPVTKREVQKSVYYLNCVVHVSLPEDFNGKIQDSESHFNIKIRETVETKFVLKLSFDNENQEFHVSGPAIAADCYNPGVTQ
ncbi:MAG: hypothetical protein KAT34_17125 [Candidatus Aminicenantes bacterium]|nr:hypothetical protein [Candidatus Aminicenantes bacterium]